MNEKKLHYVRYVQENSMPAVGEHVTAKYSVFEGITNSVDEPTLARKNQNNNFNNFNLAHIKSITSKTQAVNYKQVITKSYVDQFHQEN